MIIFLVLPQRIFLHDLASDQMEPCRYFNSYLTSGTHQHGVVSCMYGQIKISKLYYICDILKVCESFRDTYRYLRFVHGKFFSVNLLSQLDFLLFRCSCNKESFQIIKLELCILRKQIILHLGDIKSRSVFLHKAIMPLPFRLSRSLINSELFYHWGMVDFSVKTRIIFVHSLAYGYNFLNK